eukprot:5397550-Pyramimonas_sp.AAC.1
MEATCMSSRGQSGSKAQKDAVAQALDVLERNGGVPNPAESPLIEGKWRLLYTSKSSFDIKNVSVVKEYSGVPTLIPTLTAHERMHF